jgi:L-rhamnose-H+ transport protein
MSAGMSFGLQGGQTIEKLARTVEPVTSNTWRGVPVLVVVLLGGFVVNGGWCLFLNAKNQTLGDYTKSAAPLAGNLFFAALAGAIWCSQFICFKTGEPAMGSLSYIGWSVLMASMILFSTLLGIFLGEWRNTSARTRMLLTLGLAFLVASAAISGYSGYLKQ